MTDRIEDKTLVNANIKKTRRAAIIVVLLTAFTMSLTGSAMNLSIPMIGEEFDVDASTVGWMVTGYMLTIAALSVPFGRLSDITCRKTVLVTGGMHFYRRMHYLRFCLRVSHAPGIQNSSGHRRGHGAVL